MNQLKLGLISFLLIFGEAASAENIINKLVVDLVDRRLPAVLYQHTDKPWEMGTYSLTIKKIGDPGFSSTDTRMNLTLPVEAIVHGKVKQNLFGTNINMDCHSKVITDGRVQIEPKISATGTKAKVVIFIPVPESQMDCDGLKLPIKPLLEKLIADNKSQWEKDLELNINQLLQQTASK